MDVRIITVHTVLNYGSALQVYATSRVLEEMGHSVKVIDYWRSHDRLRERLFEILLDSNKTILKRVLSVGYKSIELSITRSIFSRFYRDNLKFTKKYNSYAALAAAPPKAEVFVSGSDQIWNKIYNRCIDKCFYLDFVQPGCKRVAYAASFGVDRLSDDEIEETSELIRKFDAISVREDSGLGILEKLGREDACHVLDPTMLLTKKDWTGIAQSFQHDEPYLLIYSVEKKATETVIECARAIAKKRNLKIYNITAGGFRQSINGSDKEFQFKSPQFFLAAFLNAQFVVVSSFHGTAFSINFEKQFVSVVPDRFSTRSKSILKLFDLEERLVISVAEAIKASDQIIDYTLVSKKVDTERHKSLQFLTDAIGC